MSAALVFIMAWQLGAQSPPAYPTTQQQAYASIRRLRTQEKSGVALTLAQRIELAMSYHAAGQHMLFRNILEECRTRHPREAEVHFLLARHYGSDVQDWDKAVEYFRAALAYRRDARTLAYLANALETTGQSSDALPLYKEAVRLSPCQPLALTGLGRLREISPDAIVACQPRDPNLLLETAKLLTTAGRLADAAHVLEQAALAAPHNPAIPYRLYRLYQDTGNPEKAKAALERHRELRAIYDSQ